MNALHETGPELIDFPDPRQAPPRRRERISLQKPPVDSILKRMSQGEDVSAPKNKPVDSSDDSDDPEALEEAEKEEFRKERREVTRIHSESMERMRVARELELLLDAREKVLDNREALLKAQKSEYLPESDISAMERSLLDIRKVLETASDTLTKMEGILSSRRAKLVSELKSGAADPTVGNTKPVTGYDDITDASLVEQVAFLKEREAYVEQSENVLFEKAQHLQEWQTRLEQMEDDSNAPESDDEEFAEKEA